MRSRGRRRISTPRLPGYGATAPTDRAGLAAVAQSIDTNTALGREQMAALQALTGSFDTVFAARSRRRAASAVCRIVSTHPARWRGHRPISARHSANMARPRRQIGPAWQRWPAASTPTPRSAAADVRAGGVVRRVRYRFPGAQKGCSNAADAAQRPQTSRRAAKEARTQRSEPQTSKRVLLNRPPKNHAPGYSGPRLN